MNIKLRDIQGIIILGLIIYVGYIAIKGLMEMVAALNTS